MGKGEFPLGRLLGVALIAAGAIALILVVRGRLWHDETAATTAPPPSLAWPYPYKTGRSSTTEKEIAYYKQRIKRDPNSGPDYALLATAYLHQARVTMDPAWYILADQAGRESLAHQPVQNRGAMLVLARVAEARHDFREALQLIRDSGPQEDDAIALRATCLLNLGEVPEAAETAHLLVQRGPSTANYGLAALVEIAQGHDDAAFDDFRRALSREEVGENYASAWLRVMLGRLSFRRGHLALARALYTEALRIMPGYPLALAQLGELQTAAGELAEADKNYDAAFQTAQQPAWLLARARIHEAQGDAATTASLREEARKILEQQLTGGAFGHRRDLARLYLDRKQPGDAARAVALLKDEAGRRRDSETIDLLAVALLADGHAAEALPLEQEALKWGLRDAGMQHHLGDIQHALGHETEATAAYAESRRINPGWRAL